MQFAGMLTVLSNLVQYYVYLSVFQAGADAWTRFGPTCMVAIAAALLMVHPTVFLLKDLHVISPVCRNPWGMYAVYGCTDAGFVALIVAASWAVRHHEDGHEWKLPRTLSS
mmetsp:Transcript_54301/g.142996  ORF Transcript_54301/g.142996 Transcript_54301/m.142996 type:complete len:111 (-) Transcript_54301:99-431(-)